jgi:hypothetical protein
VLIRFNTTTGLVEIGSRRTVRSDMTVEDIQNLDVTFTQAFDRKTGWILRSAAPILIDGVSVGWSFNFYEDHLKALNLVIGADATLDQALLREKHNELVVKQLGEPTEKKGDWIIYRYPWGEIGSGTDFKNGFSTIVVRWS